MVTTNTDVYATDFYAWCLTTAQLVRTGQWDEIDPEALAEELESVGRSQKRELESRLEVLLIHLLKWQYQPERRVDSHSWYDTILEQRSQIVRLLRDNPSLRPQVPNLLQEIYPEARARAHGQMGLVETHSQAHGAIAPLVPLELPDVAFRLRLPPDCPWAATEVLDKEFWPLPLS
jgi:Domain of unknown function DUF29